MLAACTTASALRAQTLRIRAVDSLSSLPIAGALVSTVSPDGALGTPVITSSDGLAALHVESAGAYRVRVRRIGFAPFTSGELRVAGDRDSVVTLAVPSVHVTLGAVRVVERRACDRRVASPSAGAAPVWEEVRKALETSRLSRAASYVSINAVGYERQFAANGTLERVDTTARGTAATQPFAARAPDLLEAQGYVSGSWQTGLTFYGPDEDALLSAAFTRTHCVWLTDARRDAAGTLVGLAFEPLAERRLPEIRGTIWVDSASSELRRVEFEYEHVPFPVDVRGVGGHVAFSRASSGAWFVSSWMLRLPRWRSSNLERSGARLAGFTEAAGEAAVARESRVAESDARRTITGTVWDSAAGRALVNGLVRIPALGLETHTDVAGSFRFDGVAVGVHRLTVEPPVPHVPGQVAEAVADVVASARTDVTLALPGFAAIWQRACPATPLPDGPGTVTFGRVTMAIGGLPDSAATVELAWLRSGRTESVRTHADSAGHYVACAPTAGRLTIAATDGDASATPVMQGATAARVVHRDLALASRDVVERLTPDYVGEERVAGAPAVLAGIVRDALGRPVPNARLVLAGAVDSARTDSAGHFVMRSVPAGRRLALVGALGYTSARRLLDLYPGDSAFMDVRLARLTTLATVTVTERQRVSALRDAVAQRARAGMGYITDSLQLAKVSQTWMALEVPNATVVQNGPYSWAVTIARVTNSGMVNCVPAVWIDDQLSEFEQFAMVPKDDIGVIEFYSRAANVPLRYGGSARLSQYANWATQQNDPTGKPTVTGGNRPRARTDSTLTRGDCGVVLVWTKPFLSLGSPSP